MTPEDMDAIAARWACESGGTVRRMRMPDAAIGGTWVFVTTARGTVGTITARLVDGAWTWRAAPDVAYLLEGTT